MAPSEPTWPSWQWPFLMNFEPFPKGLRQVLSQIIGGAAGGGEGGGDGDGGGGDGDGGGGEGEGGSAGGEECNVTVPPSQEIRATLAAHLSLVLSMALAQASPESPCRLRPEWNSACVLKEGVSDRMARVAYYPLPASPWAKLKDKGFELCVREYACV